MNAPSNPKIYHIVHIDRLPSILATGGLLSDALMRAQGQRGTSIGDTEIKAERLQRQLQSHEGLNVGECVPFYFCPRSVLLYINHMGNRPRLQNRQGQRPIVHLEADFHDTVKWANRTSRRWAFTDANAAKQTTNDYKDLAYLDQIQWDVVLCNEWRGKANSKMAEFLVEVAFPWSLIRRIGVHDKGIQQTVDKLTARTVHKPAVEVRQDWYYEPQGGAV